MSETGEEKEAIELIAVAEKDIRARLETARRKAKQIVADAERLADETIRAKESELNSLETAGYFGERKSAGDEAVTVPEPPRELVDRLAREIFARITGESADGPR
jgi:vacuolar-type H+-ATPase subunit H